MISETNMKCRKCLHINCSNFKPIYDKHDQNYKLNVMHILLQQTAFNYHVFWQCRICYHNQYAFRNVQFRSCCVNLQRVALKMHFSFLLLSSFLLPTAMLYHTGWRSALPRLNFFPKLYCDVHILLIEAASNNARQNIPIYYIPHILSGFSKEFSSD